MSDVAKSFTECHVSSLRVIERKYDQRQLGEGFIGDSFEDCWEPWMKKADEILNDEELIGV